MKNGLHVLHVIIIEQVIILLEQTDIGKKVTNLQVIKTNTQILEVALNSYQAKNPAVDKAVCMASVLVGRAVHFIVKAERLENTRK